MNIHQRNMFEEKNSTGMLRNGEHLFSRSKRVLAAYLTPLRKYLRPRDVGLFVLLISVFAIGKIFGFIRTKTIHAHPSSHSKHCYTLGLSKQQSLEPAYQISMIENSSYRHIDSIDTFAHYKFRNHPQCNISSLDLYKSSGSLCKSREHFLDAFSGGGRIGFGAPFMTRNCDMRWFSTEEICNIFSRFEKVIVIGDSMMRHVVGALNVLLRKDLGYGAVTDWNFDDQESRDCFCNRQFDVKDCSVQGIFRTSDVLANSPESFACNPATDPVNLIIEMMLRFPLDPTEIARFKSLLPNSGSTPEKPYAFVFGHGLWNDLDLQATVNWLEAILEAMGQEGADIASTKAYQNNHGRTNGRVQWPMLFVTPNAAGVNKPDQWVMSQGDKALQIFEKSIREEVKDRRIEHLGTWNMSIQMDKWDGVHLDLKGNLVKAMGVVNWLSMLDL